MSRARMSAGISLRAAVRALLRNKLRSALTALGIVIGVAAVIATMALGAGAQARVADTFASMGTNLLIVFPGSFTSGGARGGMGSASSITWEDLRAIRTDCPSVQAAAPELRSAAQIVSEQENWNTQITGTSPELFTIRHWEAASGRTLDDGDVEARAQVIVLGRTTADRLFGAGADPIGETVRIKAAPFRVVGVMAKKGKSAMGQDQDDAAFLPVTTFQARVQGRVSNTLSGVLLVSASSAAGTGQAQEELAALLRERHHVEPGGDDDFSVGNLSEVAESEQQSARTIAVLLASIAAVSLVVGGIGIMNIMLVSVTERTREIGLRAAVGARRSQILSQFLAEAVVLSVLGGATGVALGVGISAWLARSFGWAVLVDPMSVVVALAFSAGVGIAFGLYPAYRASRLDPIAALRHE